MRNYIITFCFAILFSFYSEATTLKDPTFEEGMTDSSHTVKAIWDQYKELKFNKLISDVYTERSPSKMLYRDSPIIPKVMHQIWLGSAPLPPLYQNYMEECRLLHPDWEFKLWTDKDVNNELPPIYQNIYKISRSWLQKSDILRYAILLNHGGVYRDTDIKCYQSLNELNHKYSFYAVTEFILPKLNGYLAVNNGFIGAVKNHPIIQDTLTIINGSLSKNLEIYDNGSEMEIYPNISWFVIRTTMFPLRDAIQKHLESDKNAIIFPAIYEFSTVKYSLYEVYKPYSFINFVKLLSSNALQEPYPFGRKSLRSFINHNTDKEEFGKISFANGMDMYEPARASAFEALKAEDKHMLHSFLLSYRENNGRILPFKSQDEIPKRILFIVFNDSEKEELEINKQDWIVFNRNFVQDVWDKQKILTEFPKLSVYFDDKKYDIEQLRFLAGIELINKFGGHYADYRAKPLSPLFEFGNKYKLYIGLQPVNEHRLELLASNRLIGSVANGPILSQALDEFYRSNKMLSSNLVALMYKNLWLYGKMIVLPSAFLGPRDPLETKGWLNKIDGIYVNYKSFISDRHSSYAIIE